MEKDPTPEIDESLLTEKQKIELGKSSFPWPAVFFFLGLLIIIVVLIVVVFALGGPLS